MQNIKTSPFIEPLTDGTTKHFWSIVFKGFPDINMLQAPLLKWYWAYRYDNASKIILLGTEFQLLQLDDYLSSLDNQEFKIIHMAPSRKEEIEQFMQVNNYHYHRIKREVNNVTFLNYNN